MGSKRRTPLKPVVIEGVIHVLRGERIIMDADLARIYGVPTHRFNEAVKRNRDRFPDDFMFRLTQNEYDGLISQFAISKTGRGGRRSTPYAFTEHGAIMAANVLRSKRAIDMSLFVVRAFVSMRRKLGSTTPLLRSLVALEKRIIERENKRERVILEVFSEVKKLMDRDR